MSVSLLVAKGKFVQRNKPTMESSSWLRKQSAQLGELTLKQMGRAPRPLLPVWETKLGSKSAEVFWVGTTGKDEPYTEKEFYKIREAKILEQLDVLRAEHVAQRRAEAKGADGVEDLLDEFDDLLEDPGEVEVSKEDLNQYLKDFDEETVKRTVARKVFVSQSRSVITPALFVQNEDNELYCYELKTGRALWVLGLEERLLQQPFETEKHLFIVEAGCCKIIDKRSGSLLDRMRFRKAVHPRVFSKEGEVYALAYDGVLFAMGRGERFPRWSTRVGGRGNVGVWGYEGGLFVPLDSGFCKSYTFSGREQWDFSSKAISEEKIYLEKKRAKLAKHVEDERMNARTKGRPEDLEYIKGYKDKIALVDEERSLLRKRNRGGFRAEPTFGGSKMFVGNVDFQLYCLDSYSGLPIWSYPCQGQLTEPPMVRGEDVWQLDQRGHLHHLQVDTGVGRVFERGVGRVVMASSDTIVYVTESGELNLRYKTGQTVVQIDGAFVKKGRFLGYGEEGYLFWVGKGGELKAYSLSTEQVMN